LECSYLHFEVYQRHLLEKVCYMVTISALMLWVFRCRLGWISD